MNLRSHFTSERTTGKFIVLSVGLSMPTSKTASQGKIEGGKLNV
jgi:hypothetical protein